MTLCFALFVYLWEFLNYMYQFRFSLEKSIFSLIFCPAHSFLYYEIIILLKAHFIYFQHAPMKCLTDVMQYFVSTSGGHTTPLKVNDLKLLGQDTPGYASQISMCPNHFVVRNMLFDQIRLSNNKFCSRLWVTSRDRKSTQNEAIRKSLTIGLWLYHITNKWIHLTAVYLLK